MYCVLWDRVLCAVGSCMMCCGILYYVLWDPVLCTVGSCIMCCGILYYVLWDPHIPYKMYTKTIQNVKNCLFVKFKILLVRMQCII